MAKRLESASSGAIIDLDDVFHELTTQLMGRMAYDVSTSDDTFLGFINID